MFIEKVRDVVGLYMNPPEHAIVLSIDEKSQVQALDRTQPLPMEPWQVERHTHDYARHGTTSFFAAIAEKCIRRSAYRSVTALKKAIMNYLDEHNKNPKPFVWVASADLILERVENVCKRISNSGH